MKRSQDERGEGVFVGICRECSVDSRRRKGDEMYDKEIERILEKERVRIECKEVESGEVYKRGRKGKENEMVVEERKNGGGEDIKLSEVCFSKK